MHSKSALYYDVRVATGLASLLPLLALPVLALLLWLFLVLDGEVVTPYASTRAFELVLPLSCGVMAAHFMTIEQGVGMAELRASYPESSLWLPAVRTALASSLAAIAAVVGGVAFQWVAGPLSWRSLIMPAVAPAIFMLGLSLLTGNLTRSYWAAAAVVMGYWFFELQTRGQVTKTLFLFDYSWPVVEADYTVNRCLLTGVGVGLLIANGWLSACSRQGKGI